MGSFSNTNDGLNHPPAQQGHRPADPSLPTPAPITEMERLLRAVASSSAHVQQRTQNTSTSQTHRAGAGTIDDGFFTQLEAIARAETNLANTPGPPEPSIMTWLLYRIWRVLNHVSG